MPKCVFSLLLVPLLASCTPSAEPQPAEVPVQAVEPLVIGTSSPTPSGTVPDVPRQARIAIARTLPVRRP
jgi:hypothetical protein